MELADLLQMPRVKNDSTHLGLPLLMMKTKLRDMSFILNRVNSRVLAWKANLLSKAERTTLVQIVDSSLVLYVATLGSIPCSIQESVDKSLRSFWWGDTSTKRKVQTISWGKPFRPKLFGGLEFRSSKSINEAFMGKRAWEILSKKNGMRHDLVRAKYLKDGNLLTYNFKPFDSQLWKGIMKSVSLLQKGVCRRIGNGKTTSIWFDN
ncbi:uncharacterized mitochondrial protein AtMg00310-like [Humulus lupulus]|uniref:uncharacterized mitochondrial protein AtMg00310-like n=1 Tax=Humulus lupulus TaxID=3486 RepID=UPI002B410F99|nr:uncharacterized mitochondrial protein AtMg00310-like [Humulus lupulus]